MQHKGRVDTLSNSRENKNKVNAGILKLHRGGRGGPTKRKGKDQKVKNLTEDLHKTMTPQFKGEQSKDAKGKNNEICQFLT